MTGLYALKPWYAARLRPVLDELDSHRVTPNQLTCAGVAFAALAGALIALVPSGPLTAAVVAGLLAARLACANMDGSLARRRGPSAVGGVTNELGDRLADVLLLAGFATHLGTWTGALLFATTLPSWTSLCLAAQGGPRLNTGPMGKTERCLAAAIAAGTGWFAPVAIVIAAGAVITAGARLALGRQALHVVTR